LRIMALDVGDSRIGVALSDPMEVLASPLVIIKRLNETSDIQSVAKMVDEHAVGKLIVGLPLSLSGGEGIQVEKVKAFVNSLKTILKIPLAMVDERFSTVTAREYMRESGGKKKGRFKKHDDAIAAAVILQGYLDEGAASHS
jgi:putative holliday junction resolvase